MTTKTTARSAASEAAQAGTDAAKTAAGATKDTAKTAADAATDAAREATATFGSLAAESQRNLSESLEKFSKGLEGLTSFSQENVEAVVKSSEIAVKAFEGIGSEISAYSRKSFEDGVAAAQDLASARTVTELFEKQTAYAQTAFEGWLNQTSKMNEILAAAAKDITTPIGERLSAASDAVKSFTL
ncbi:MAG TPA: TIGR01841 family phasin [Paracoccaceae bacterium]|nr:TIGR01841 family phasin [Paracoccaceae bacterium]